LTFYLEDLELKTPRSEGVKSSIKYVRNLSTGGIATDSKQSITYDILLGNDTTAKQLEELCNNPHFSTVCIRNLDDRTNQGLITAYKKNRLATHSTANITMSNGQGNYLFTKEEAILDVAKRWKYPIDENFDSGRGWPSNASCSGSKTSTTDGLQVRSMIWDDEGSGTWETDSDGDFLSGNQCLTKTDAVDGYYVSEFDWWGDYTVSSYVLFETTTSEAGLVFRYTDNSNHMRFIYSNGELKLQSVSSGSPTDIASVTVSGVSADVFYEMKVECLGDRYKCHFANDVVFDTYDDTYRDGKVGIYSTDSGDSFDKFRVITGYPDMFNLQHDTVWTNQTVYETETTAYGTEKKVIAGEKEIITKWESATQSDTPATVFMYESTARIYGPSHDVSDWSNITIDNGLVKLIFDVTSNVITPSVQFYYSSAWNTVADIFPYGYYSETDIDSSISYTSSEAEIIKLSDQYAEICLYHYINNSSTFPEGTVIKMNFIIRSGLPAVLIKTDDSYCIQNEEKGFNITLQTGVNKFAIPDTTVYTATTPTTQNVDIDNADDNFCCFYAGTSGTLAVCLFTDSINEDGNNIFTAISTPPWDEAYVRQTNIGGISAINYADNATLLTDWKSDFGKISRWAFNNMFLRRSIKGEIE
jgi:hypothetical protein